MIRFRCKTHDRVLTSAGSGRVFYPTYNNGEDEYQSRLDENGWLTLDASELFCPEAANLEAEVQKRWDTLYGTGNDIPDEERDKYNAEIDACYACKDNWAFEAMNAQEEVIEL